MQINWLNGRGEDRAAQSISQFIHNGQLYHVAFDPDFQKPMIYADVGSYVGKYLGNEPTFVWVEPVR